MNAILLLYLSLCSHFVESEDVGCDDFIKITKSLHASISSIDSLYEGESWFYGTNGQKDQADQVPIRFQGHYVVRYRGGDAAGLVNWYTTRVPGEAADHRSMSFLHGYLEDSHTPAMPIPYDVNAKGRRGKRSGSDIDLLRPQSPQFLIWTWYFASIDQLPKEYLGYEFLGWEQLDGHRCLKVRTKLTPNPLARRANMIMWLDLERGGHALRVDHFIGENIFTRVKDVRLDRIATADGSSVWLPVSGIREGFAGGDGTFHDEPTGRESTGLILGSIRINEDLPDSVFVVHTKAKKLTENAARLAAKVTSVKESTPPPRPRTDPASVQKRLQAELEEASRQARELEASSPAREAWSWTQAMQLGLAVLGVSAIGAAVYWRRRLS